MRTMLKGKLFIFAVLAVTIMLGLGISNPALACYPSPNPCPIPPSEEPGITVSPPVIDEETQGDWEGKYGSCFFLIPDPDIPVFENPIGPDFYRQFPEQYASNNCFGGDLFDAGNVDWRIFRQTEDGNAFAFSLASGEYWEALPQGEQWNPCKNTFRGATWDSDLAISDPLVVDLHFDLVGSARIAYYFLDAANVCRTEDLSLYVNGELKTDTPVRISDFAGGKYVVFELSGLTGETTVKLEARLVPQEESACVIEDPVLYYGVNSHISGVFVDCNPEQPLCFEVNYVKAKDKCGAYFDWLTAKGSMKLADGMTFDPATDEVTLTMWDETFTIPAGSFKKIEFWGFTLYQYTGDLPDMGKISMYLNFKECRWKVYLSKKYTKAYIDSDGTTIGMTIGSAVGSDSFEWTNKYSYWGTNYAKFYELNPTLCCPKTPCKTYCSPCKTYSPCGCR